MRVKRLDGASLSPARFGAPGGPNQRAPIPQPGNTLYGKLLSAGARHRALKELADLEAEALVALGTVELQLRVEQGTQLLVERSAEQSSANRARAHERAGEESERTLVQAQENMERITRTKQKVQRGLCEAGLDAADAALISDSIEALSRMAFHGEQTIASMRLRRVTEIAATSVQGGPLSRGGPDER